MAQENTKKNKAQERFDREANALRANLQKRKKQAALRDKYKKEEAKNSQE